MALVDGQSCVQVLYDFDYTSDDGRLINIQEGEELLLIRKTNNDWWQVIRDGENRPFYAPVSYLTVIDEELVVPTLIKEGGGGEEDIKCDLNANTVVKSDFSKLNENMVLYVSNPLYEESLPKKIVVKKTLNKDNEKRIENGVKEKLDDGITVIHIPGPTSTKLNLKTTLKEEGKLLLSSESENEYESIDDDGTRSTDSAYNERLQKVEEECTYEVLESDISFENSLIEESENPIYANFPLMSSAIPPQPTENDFPVKVLFNRWSEYQDDRGRKFYFNSLSKETTWKPPRRLNDGSPCEDGGSQDISIISDLSVTSPVKDSPPQPPTPPKKPKPKLVTRRHHWPNKGEQSSSQYEYNTASSNDSLDSPSTPPVSNSFSPYSSTSSLPRGWSQFLDQKSGENYFVNNKSKEKWFSSMDDSGTTYYYAENSNQSVWNLPEEHLATIKSDNSGQIREVSQAPGVPVAPPQVPPSHMLRSPPSKMLDRKSKTHSVVEPSWQAPTLYTEKSGKSASLPRGLVPPGKETQRQWPQLKDGCMVVSKQGTLNKTVLLEAGRRLKKHWTQAYVTLTNLYLLFYKDSKSAQQFQQNGGCKPEITVDLAGALIKWSSENSRRKNVFEITTVLGQQILLQDDNDQTMKEWFESVTAVVKRLPSNSIWAVAHTSIAGNTKDKDKIKKGGHLSRKKSTKQKNRESSLKSSDNNGSPSGASSSTTNDDQSGCTSPNERKRRIRDKLRNFFLRRPSMESLREKGIIKDEPVFGCHLHNLCVREKSTVPKFVQLCIEAIEKKDMSADGLYRASGNLSQVQKLRFQINQDDYDGLKTEDDVHVLTGALKMFFRDMKEPLFPFDTFDNFLAAISINDKNVKLTSITELVRGLPKPNSDTLKFLLKHLVRVTKLSDKNRMHVQNVAIVFGPTLLWPLTDSADLALDMMHQNQIIELLLLEFVGIFR